MLDIYESAIGSSGRCWCMIPFDTSAPRCLVGHRLYKAWRRQDLRSSWLWAVLCHIWVVLCRCVSFFLFCWMFFAILILLASHLLLTWSCLCPSHCFPYTDSKDGRYLSRTERWDIAHRWDQLLKCVSKNPQDDAVRHHSWHCFLGYLTDHKLFLGAGLEQI